MDGFLYRVVIDGTGHAFATNIARNQVEVLSLATRTLEAPIPVGAQPQGLDLSADGHTLYVANAGEHSISVVDVATRHEVRRIAVPAGDFNSRPFSIAVANNGIALLSVEPSLSGSQGLLQMDLAHETVTLRAEPIYGASLQASGDRSRLAVNDGSVRVYTVATDTFTNASGVGSPYKIGLDGTGSTFVVNPDGNVLDHDLNLVATIPSGGRGTAVNWAGTIAYRMQTTNVDVLDLVGHYVSAIIQLLDYNGGSGAIALSPDETTLVITTEQGFSAAPVSAVVPTPCPPPGTAAIVAICGAPLGDAVIDGSGHAFVTNPARNRVEVVNLATGALEAPIPVQSLPRGLDFSADGSILYVANAGANAISVIDVAQRRELRRIPFPSWGDRPWAIAVAANGTALVTSHSDNGAGGRVLQLALATETWVVRTLPNATTDNQTRLEPSADRSRIALMPYSTRGTISLYRSSTNDFAFGGKSGTTARDVAASGDGTRWFAGPSGAIFDRDLVMRGTVDGGGGSTGVAMNRAGTVGYRVQPSSVDVIDLNRGLVTGSIALPGSVGAGPGLAALSADEATLVVLTATGLTIVHPSAAVPTPACVPPTAPAGVTPVCGALAELVMDAGHIYATNPSRNQVEVVNVATGALEAPIPVGAQPAGLDFSLDGHLLYVANAGDYDVSVVDLALRREVRRITVAPDGWSTSRPHSIAVAKDNTALVGLIDPNSELANLVQIDLAHDTPVVVQNTLDHARVEASADRSRIAVVENGQYGGTLRIYDAATGAFTTNGGVQATFVALNKDASALLLSPHGDSATFAAGAITLTGTIQGGGGGDVAMDRAGTVAYGVDGAGVDVIDMARKAVTRALRLPEPPAGEGRSRIALSADASRLAVLTTHGIAIRSIPTGLPQTPFTIWQQAGSTPRDGLGTWIATANDPTAGPDQLAPQYLYGHYFGFTGSSATGLVGVVADPTGKFAVFNVVETNGTQHTAVVPFNWTGGRLYFPLAYQLSPGTWAAWVFDNTAGTWTGIGVLSLPTSWGKVAPGSITAIVWYGPAGDCPEFPRADAYFYPAMGYAGTAATPASATSSGAGGAGACAATRTSESPRWSHYRVGS